MQVVVAIDLLGIREGDQLFFFLSCAFRGGFDPLDSYCASCHFGVGVEYDTHESSTVIKLSRSLRLLKMLFSLSKILVIVKCYCSWSLEEKARTHHATKR